LVSLPHLSTLAAACHAIDPGMSHQLGRHLPIHRGAVWRLPVPAIGVLSSTLDS
jgi:hypothetical protein